MVSCVLETDVSVEEALRSEEFEVVGGTSETGYLPAGYVASSLSAIPVDYQCSAVQIGPNLVATAAHCFYDKSTNPPTLLGGNNYGFGRGAWGTVDFRVASSIVIHPSYDPSASLANRHKNDLALMRFDKSLPGGTWAEVGAAIPGSFCGTNSVIPNHTYVGYGRTTAGGQGTPGAGTLRKSATECVIQVNAISLNVVGVSGGLCWGDSGGGLFETGKDLAVGVLADFDGTFDCQVGNAMVFTRLNAYQSFICNNTTYVGDGGFCGRSLVAELMAI